MIGVDGDVCAVVGRNLYSCFHFLLGGTQDVQGIESASTPPPAMILVK